LHAPELLAKLRQQRDATAEHYLHESVQSQFGELRAPGLHKVYLCFAGGVCIMRLCRRCCAAAAARLLRSCRLDGLLLLLLLLQLMRAFGSTHGRHVLAVV
jgi:hypothetical protein